MTAEYLEYDVVVCGSGAAGLTAAVVCAQNGQSVLLLEKANLFGGTTAYSMGVPWIPNNDHMQEVGQEDSLENAEKYLRALLGDYYDENKIRAFLTSAPEMLRHLEATTELRLFAIPLPDYYPYLPGARAGRSLFVKEFEGARLGAPRLKNVRIPLRGFVAFKSMQVGLIDLPRLQNASRSLADFRFTVGRLAAYAWQRLRYGKGAVMANGNALVGTLMHAAAQLGVQLWNGTQATALLRNDEGVTGLRVSRDGKPIEIRVRKAVVLATGGFGGNVELTRKYLPMPADHISVQPSDNSGDGIALAEAVGGTLAAGNVDNGIWAPVSALRGNSGEILTKYPHFGNDRAKPGSLVVNLNGVRFVNEAAPYQVFVKAMHDQDIRKAWLIADKAFIRKYGMGLALPAMPYGDLVRQGYLIEAPTIGELADKISVNAVALTNTVERFNDAASNGVDPEYGRGSNTYDQSQGDFGHNPPNLRPLLEGPFYAVALYPGDVSTVLGLVTDENGQVLDDQGVRIAGLYAVGLDQNTIFRGFYPGGGASLGPAMTFAYRAAQQITRGATN